MARQVLDNGVILPSEYSDDWYDDMTSNLTKLDEVIGSDAEKLDESDVGEAAISNDYDDLDNKPAYNILRRASVTLTAGGTGNYSDLDSTSKIKAGDYVLDAANKLYSITAIDAANSTYTVSAAALFTVTDKAELGAAALSNSYDDLNNLPGYGILRFCSTAITDNSNVAFANISSVSKIAAGDFLLDTAGKLYQIASVDTVNETAAVTTPVSQLALDANVMHLSGNESASGDKNFRGLLTTIPSSTLWPAVSNTSDDIKLLGNHVVHVEQLSSGKLTDLSGGAWNVVELGLGCFFFRYNSGTDIRYKQLNTGDINRIPVVSGSNRFIHDVTPNQDNTYNLGSSSLRWRSINNINPGALCFPDLSSGLDISGYITDLTGASNINKYTPTVDGWISIGVSNADFIELYIPSSLIGGTFTKSTINSYAQAFMPVIANKEVIIALKGSSIGWAKFYPNLGNV